MRVVTTATLIVVTSLPNASVAADSEPLPVGQVVRKVQARYNKTKDLKGKFKQVYRDTLYNRARTSYGYMFVKKPGMMRWNYVSPERKAFISNGKVLWVWEPEDKQAFRNPLDSSTLSTGLTFLLGSGDLTKEFTVSYASTPKDKVGNSGEIAIKLLPRKPTAQYSYLLMAVRLADHAVVESVVVGTNSTNHFIFSELVFNSKLGTKRFRFAPPEGTRVIDASKLPR